MRAGDVTIELYNKTKLMHRFASMIKPHSVLFHHNIWYRGHF